MPRFVILEHDHPRLHWDLMLEAGEVLRTWRLLAEPENNPVAAEPAFDHRLLYLEYEGPVSGDRGDVKRWDHGSYLLEQEQPDRLILLLSGVRLRGRAVLEHTAGGWLFRREGEALASAPTA
jgi:hypothetical protein